jgi:hypothetical protein
VKGGLTGKRDVINLSLSLAVLGYKAVSVEEAVFKEGASGGSGGRKREAAEKRDMPTAMPAALGWLLWSQQSSST